MKRKSFKNKIIIPTFIVLAALVIILNVFLSIRFSKMGNYLVNEKLIAITHSLKRYLEESKEDTKMAAHSMAFNPEIVKAVKSRDKNELIKVFDDAHDYYNVDYFTITDKEGKVLARTQGQENTEESVIAQQNIKDALDGKTRTYFEEETIERVSVRTGAPVYDAEGKLIGAISAGIRFDLESKVEELKNLFGSEVTIFHGDKRIITTITRAGQSIVGTTLNHEIAEIVIKNKQEYLGDAEILGQKYKTFYKPLLNAQNEAFATFFLGIPLADLKMETNNSIEYGIILGLSGLTV